MKKSRRPKRPKQFIDHSVVVDGDTLTMRLPILLVSEANKRGHWRVGYNRKCQQQQQFRAYAAPARAFIAGAIPCQVTFTRIGVGRLDIMDNLQGSVKHVADALADMMGTKDHDARIDWQRVLQRREGRKYGVEVVVKWKPKRNEQEAA